MVPKVPSLRSLLPSSRTLPTFFFPPSFTPFSPLQVSTLRARYENQLFVELIGWVSHAKSLPLLVCALRLWNCRRALVLLMGGELYMVVWSNNDLVGSFFNYSFCVCKEPVSLLCLSAVWWSAQEMWCLGISWFLGLIVVVVSCWIVCFLWKLHVGRAAMLYRLAFECFVFQEDVGWDGVAWQYHSCQCSQCLCGLNDVDISKKSIVMSLSVDFVLIDLWVLA